MAEVRFEGVTKRFGDVVAVDDFTLEVSDEEFLVLVGPSGSGKSTVLRMLAGLDDVTSGEIYIGPREVSDVPAKDRDIAMVFQSYALYPHMSVYDNMAFGLTLRGVPEDEIRTRVEEAAGVLGIGALLERKPGQLSGGQRQRVALGRAIVRQPAVFLLDEPLSNLDAKLRVQTRAEISKLHARLGTTFIYVTHDQTEAMTMATRIAVLDEGRLQQVGAPQTLYDHPTNLFVAGFIGSPAMNVFDARVVGDGDGLAIETEHFRVPVPDERAAALEGYRDREIVFGLRPENIHDPRYQPSGIEGQLIEATVDVTELMGNEIFMHLVAGPAETAGQPTLGERAKEGVFLGRVDPRSDYRPGDQVEVVLDMSNMHAFDVDTEEAIGER